MVGEEDSSAQLFHASRVHAALAYEAEKEAAVVVEKAAKDAKKAQAIENKQRKEAEAQKKALQCQVDREVKAQAKAEKEAAKEAQKKQLKLPKKNGKKSLIIVLPYKKTSNSSMKVVSFAKEVEVVGEVEGSKMAETRTRKIKLPERFKNC